MNSLDDALTTSRAAERRKAARALLKYPLLNASGSRRELFVLVTKHQQDLREWFDAETGWRLVSTTEAVRLAKSGLDPDPGWPAVEVGGARLPFSRRRYVLTCLALAVLERSDQQITLGRLAEQVMLAATDPALVATGLVFTMERRDERADMVAVARLLLDLGVLARVVGEENSFVDNVGDVLYDVRRRTMSLLLTSARGPSTLLGAPDRAAALTHEPPAATAELRTRAIRHRITRLLLDEPVLYYDRLTAEEAAYLTGQRTAICRRITDFTGLAAEVRAEGIAMVDPADDLTDVRMPETGTDGHVTLLVAEYLAAAPGSEVPIGDLERLIQGQAAEFVRQRIWRSTAADPGAAAALVRTALAKLTALRLVRATADYDRIAGLPAIARYRVAAPIIVETGKPR
ncbi:TIGR02678 family protein [Nocardia thailandica]|uniref:TIGR02678 family protein n=1 Tax=Nocardia thailandica TaxID=257275 RepID=UPI0002FD7771|nr:TIGR02678 family protein [Nocardia thailandica]